MLARPSPCVEDAVDSHLAAHRPVLLAETLKYLRPAEGGVFVDATLGAGGHAEAILEAVGPSGRLVGIDRDPEALDLAARRLERYGASFVPVHGNHERIADILVSHGIFAVDGVVADLGISSMQVDDPGRGFSFRQDGPLDMRMDRTSGPTAADLVATLPEEELRRILRDYGEERRAASLARAMVRERARGPLDRTLALASLVERVAGPSARRYRIHPATRVFQALRVAVNRELDSIEGLVRGAVSILRRGGRLVVISFHSLEDRTVKRTLRSLAERCICPPGLPVCGCGKENLVRVLTPRGISPDDAEIQRNPRSRSARLRSAERV